MKALKSPKAVTVTADTFATLAPAIASAMEAQSKSKTEAGKLYARTAHLFDTISKDWTLVKFNKIKNPEGALKEFTGAGIPEKAMRAILAGRTVILEALSPADRKVAWQATARHSMGYTGSAPLHPEVKAKAVKAAKGEKAEKGEKESEMVSLADVIAKRPQHARIALSQIHAGLSTAKALRKQGKMAFDKFDEVLALIEEAAQLCSAL
jgi:hypothetical protein